MNRSSSNSVEVNEIGSPARITSWLSSSRTKSPTTSCAPLSTLVTQRHRHHLGQDGFVVDDEHANRIAVRAAHDHPLNGGSGLRRHNLQYPLVTWPALCASFACPVKGQLPASTSTACRRPGGQR